MNQILVVESSPNSDRSLTRQLTGKVEQRLRSAHPEARIIRRDLAESPIPHLDEAAVRELASMAKGVNPSSAGALALSDTLADELVASDLIVIASPMWNFGVPSSLKAWVDHIVRGGKTYRYSDKGPVGLAAGKQAILVIASGGVYSSGPLKSFDFVEPYLRQILNFIGIQDIQTVRAEGVSVSSIKDVAISNAQRAVELLSV